MAAWGQLEALAHDDDGPGERAHRLDTLPSRKFLS
jgi:hypothetical protein